MIAATTAPPADLFIVEPAAWMSVERLREHLLREHGYIDVEDMAPRILALEDHHALLNTHRADHEEWSGTAYRYGGNPSCPHLHRHIPEDT